MTFFRVEGVVEIVEYLAPVHIMLDDMQICGDISNTHQNLHLEDPI